jgi:hypothetical protein
MLLRVPSATKFEDFPQVFNADRTARVTAGPIELAMTRNEESPQRHFQRGTLHQK